MRPFNVNLTCCIGLLVAVFFVIIGCGTQDFLDENGQRYTSFLALSDAGQDDVATIDVVRDLDCDDDGNFTDPEPFTDVFAEISITVAAETPGITLDNYTIEYIPRESIDSQGVSRLPPDLPDLTDPGSFSFSVPTSSTATFDITCMTTDQKFDYRLELAADAQYVDLFTSRYTIRVTMFYVDEFGEDKTITVDRTVYFGNYDNC